MQTCSYCGGEYTAPVELHHDERECTLRRAGVDWVTPPESFEQALIACGALTEVVVGKQAEVERLRGALSDVLAIRSDSQGVAGYHLNGNVADWDEFPEIAAAEAVLAQPTGQEVRK